MMTDTTTTPNSNADGPAVLGSIDSWVTLTQAATLLPQVSGSKVHTSTLWRWCKNGLRGVHLEHGYMGRRIVTSPEALCRFFAALAQQETTPLPPAVARRRRLRPRTSDQRRRQIEHANAILIQAGILTPHAACPSDNPTRSITKGQP